MHGVGPGPSPLECLLYAGHTGISTDEDKAIYGLNTDTGRLPMWQVMQGLRNGDAFPGVVTDDTQVFLTAARKRLRLQTLNVILPDPDFQAFTQQLIAERRRSRFTYGFPDGEGECNCITWIERLALPLLSGSMAEFIRLRGFTDYPTRRFGRCV
jgi:hypothetical protein